MLWPCVQAYMIACSNTPLLWLLSAGSNMVYMNLTNRAMPKGVQFGTDAKDLALKIDDMSTVKARGMEEGIDLQLIEVRNSAVLYCSRLIQVGICQA